MRYNYNHAIGRVTMLKDGYGKWDDLKGSYKFNAHAIADDIY